MNRRRFLAKVVAVTGGLAAVESMKNALAATGRNGCDAVACNSYAGDINIYNKCVKCGRDTFMRNQYIPRLCASCGLNNEKRCAYCGSWIYGQVQHYARICSMCYKENRCYKCDRTSYPDS